VSGVEHPGRDAREREGPAAAGYAMPDFDSGRAVYQPAGSVAGKRGSGQGVADETSGFQC